MKLPTLPQASSKYGAQMGRPDSLPLNPYQPVRLYLRRLPMVDQCYDQGGAYWGAWCPAFGGMWIAWTEHGVYIFARALDREGAKAAIKAKVPGAKFYR